MQIHSAIRSARKELGITQGRFAKKIGVTQSYLSSIESGSKKPSQEVLEKISEASNKPLSIIMFEALELDDVPENKREAFKLLQPHLKALISEIFNQ